MTVGAAQLAEQSAPLMPHLSCGQQLSVTSPDDRLRCPGSGGERPAEAAPQLRPVGGR
jgi:hypothetical protein